MPIASDFTINTTNRTIRHVTGQSTVYTVNALYTYLLDYIDDESTIQYYVPMSAQTPSEYTLINGWFLDDTSTQFLSGGAIQTSGWNTVVYVLTMSANPNTVAGDIGKTVQNGGATHTGVLLDYTTVSPYKWYVRATLSVFTAEAVTIPTGTGAGTINTVATGETIWSNIFSLGSLVAGTTLDVYQNDAQITPWWTSGHIDILVKVKESSVEIDSGNLTVLARLYGTLYDHYLIDASTGRNPVPLAAFDDGNNDTASGTVGAYTGITFDFGYYSGDLNNGNGPKPYDVVIDCGGNTILKVYEYLKYITRTGSATTFTGYGSIPGEYYTAVGDIRLTYSGLASGPFVEGNLITSSSGGTGYIVSLFAASSILVIRNVHGTFLNTNTITSGATTATISGVPDTIAASKQAPFGTYAGGQFFAARGVWIFNMHSSDTNKYTLIDSSNTTQSPPASISITINNTVVGDRVSVFKALDTNGTIHSTYLTSDNTANAIGDTTFVIDTGTPIPTDTPASGVLRVVDQPGQTDHRYRYASWTGLTFTLITASIPTGTVDTVSSNSATGFRENNADLANILPGDMIRNSSDLCWAHVLSVTLVSGSTYDVVHTPLRGGTNNFWTVGDGYRFNQLVTGYNSTDTAYVPYIDKTATGTSTSVTVQYSADQFITTRVRQKGIQPYTDNITGLTSTGYSTSVTRIPDDITT